MASEIKAVTSVVTVTEVEDVVVTVIEPVDGVQMRAIRIYGSPGGNQATPVFELRIASTDAMKLKITLPSIDI